MVKKIVKYMVCAIVCMLFIVKVFFCDYMIISGDSMNKAYADGEIVLIAKNEKSIERFDVVILKNRQGVFTEKLVKRIIGLPNETVQIIDGYVYIDGELIEDAVKVQMNDAGIAKTQIVLGEDEYFVLGDNRNNSRDSRNAEIGLVDVEQIVGKVIKKLYTKS